MGNPLIFTVHQYLLRRRGNKHFDFQNWRLRPVSFPSKDGKGAAYEEKKCMEKCFSSHQSRHLPLCCYHHWSIFPFICALTWRVNNYVSCQEKGANRRNKNPIIIIIVYDFRTFEVKFFAFHLNCCWFWKLSNNLFKNKELTQFQQLWSIFFFKNYGNAKEKAKFGSCFKKNTGNREEQSVAENVRSRYGRNVHLISFRGAWRQGH